MTPELTTEELLFFRFFLQGKDESSPFLGA